MNDGCLSMAMKVVCFPQKITAEEKLPSAYLCWASFVLTLLLGVVLGVVIMKRMTSPLPNLGIMKRRPFDMRH